MTKRETYPGDADDLRRRADYKLRGKNKENPETQENQTGVDRLVHELQVYQIELEMQNEELRNAQLVLEETRDKYIDLYDFAPVGYITLSEKGLILEANMATAGLLGEPRSALAGQSLSSFIFPEDQDIYYRHRRQLVDTGKPQACEMRLNKKDGQLSWVLLELAAANYADGSLTHRAVMSDITERKMVEDAMLFLLECGSKGDDFFASLAQHLAKSLGMDFICIDKLEGNCLSASTLAVYFDGKFEDNVSCTLHDTPCGDVVGKIVCCFPKGVSHSFPKDVVLQDMKAESYVGVTLWSNTHKPIGLIAAIGRKQVADTQLSETIMKLVAIRASAELERRLAEEEREKLINELQNALANVKQLSAMLPICSYCKKIRDDKGYWERVETYISKHTDTVFSHGACPECAEKAMKEFEKFKNNFGL